MHYKIIYHVGQDVTIKTRVNSGTLELQAESVRISGPSVLTVLLSSVIGVEMCRLHGLGRMIKMVCKDQTVFFTVVRFNLFGWFFIVNSLRTGELYETLKRSIPKVA